MGWKAHATFSPKISRTRVFDLTRTCDDKQRAHLPKAVEMADRGSADRGSSDSLVRSGNRLPSGITGHTTSCDRSEEHTSELQSLTNLVCRLLLEKKKAQSQQQFFVQTLL